MKQMSDEDYNALVSEAERVDALEAELEARRNELDELVAPEAPEKDSANKFKRELIKAGDTTRIGKATKPELGISPRTVRGYLQIARFGKALGYNTVSEYLIKQAAVTTETGMSLDMKFTELLLTDIKERKTSTISGVTSEPKAPGWFDRFRKSGA